MGPIRIKQLARCARRRVNRPLAAGLCGLVLLVDAACLPKGSTVGGVVANWSTHGCYVGPYAEIYRIPSGKGSTVSVVCSDTGFPASTSGVYLGHVPFRGDREFDRGWWACVEHVNAVPLSLDWSKLSESEANSVRQDLAAAAEREGWDDMATRIRSGDLVRRRPLPWGYVHNAISAVVALGFVMGLVATGRSVRVVLREAREAGERELLEQGRCPRCAYDLASMQAVARSSRCSSVRCPECGVEHRLSV